MVLKAMLHTHCGGVIFMVYHHTQIFLLQESSG